MARVSLIIVGPMVYVAPSPVVVCASVEIRCVLLKSRFTTSRFGVNEVRVLKLQL